MVLIFELNNQNYKIQYLKLNILNLPNITNMTNTHIFSYENTITKYSYIRVFYSLYTIRGYTQYLPTGKYTNSS